MSHILIIEDERVIRSALSRLLKRSAYSVEEAESIADAQKRFELNDFDLIITDLRLPGEPGTKVIELVQDVPVLIMTSYSSIRSAVDAIKMGAEDYIAKPFDHDEMLLSVGRIFKNRSLIKQNQALKSDISSKTLSIEGMIGSCPEMKEISRHVHKVSPTDTTVLILGESGTGKELIARALHDMSQRADGPLISVNCASIPETLIESELFGHEKGAFTGASTRHTGLVEAADGGTLFLDEIGELPLEAQARLLRLLQEKEVRRVGSVSSRKVNVRLIAATHRDLKTLAQNGGSFRQDLYYRLNVVALSLPPLRDRGDDVTQIAEKLLTSTCDNLNSKTLRYSEEALLAITQYHWPGNVRELENAIERAVILCDNEIITKELLAIDVEASSATHSNNNATKQSNSGIGNNNSNSSDSNSNDPEPTKELSLEDYFQRFVLENQDHMNETELAQKLGISRKNLWERRQRLGIPRKKTTVVNE